MTSELGHSSMTSSSSLRRTQTGSSDYVTSQLAARDEFYLGPELLCMPTLKNHAAKPTGIFFVLVASDPLRLPTIFNYSHGKPGATWLGQTGQKMIAPSAPIVAGLG
jgi:hypothetical protein